LANSIKSQTVFPVAIYKLKIHLTGAYLIMLVLQALVNNKAYMAQQLCYHKHPKSICSSVVSSYFLS